MSHDEVVDMQLKQIEKRLDAMEEIETVVKEIRGGIRLMRWIMPTLIMALITFGAYLNQRGQENEKKIIKLLTIIEQSAVINYKEKK